MSILCTNNLTIGYEGKEVLSGISFEVKPKEYLCIVGENGAGKSTLVKTVLGLIPPLSGEIIFGDGLSKNEIGYLPQQTVVQRDFPASVFEIVLSGCQGRMDKRPFYSKEEKALARENMERMNILDLGKRCYRDLSGGQQQRVLLARALCATGKLILLDEPVAGLDPRAMSELYELIKTLNKEGVTVIMISHDMQAAINYASHILFVDKNLYFGTTKDFIESDTAKKFLKLQETEG